MRYVNLNGDVFFCLKLFFHGFLMELSRLNLFLTSFLSIANTMYRMSTDRYFIVNSCSHLTGNATFGSWTFKSRRFHVFSEPLRGAQSPVLFCLYLNLPLCLVSVLAIILLWRIKVKVSGMALKSRGSFCLGSRKWNGSFTSVEHPLSHWPCGELRSGLQSFEWNAK